MKTTFAEEARHVLEEAVKLGSSMSQWGRRLKVRDGNVTDEWEPVRKASTIRRAERYNAWLHNERVVLCTKLRSLAKEYGFTDDDLRPDGRCVWNLVLAVRNQNAASFEAALSYFQANPQPYC